MYDKFGNNSFKLEINNKVSDESGDLLSIHKMSAKYLNKANNNGWSYFFVKRNDKLMSIDKLRYIADNRQYQKI
jgi:site-specific DNA-methyltransferase (adenine-specific)